MKYQYVGDGPRLVPDLAREVKPLDFVETDLVLDWPFIKVVPTVSIVKGDD